MTEALRAALEPFAKIATAIDSDPLTELVAPDQRADKVAFELPFTVGDGSKPRITLGDLRGARDTVRAYDDFFAPILENLGTFGCASPDCALRCYGGDCKCLSGIRNSSVRVRLADMLRLFVAPRVSERVGGGSQESQP